MPLKVPPNVTESLLAAQLAWKDLGQQGDLTKAWSPEQVKQLALIADCLKHVHNALKRLIDANS